MVLEIGIRGLGQFIGSEAIVLFEFFVLLSLRNYCSILLKVEMFILV